MAVRPLFWRWHIWFATALGCALAAGGWGGVAASQTLTNPVLTHAEAVRELAPAEADQKRPVRLQGVVTFFFDRHSCFVQDESAGIYVGGGQEFATLTPGDLVEIEGISGRGDYAPIVRPSKLLVLGHTNLPPARQVSFEDLMTGREDSQWVEVEGVVRAVRGDQASGQTLEMASGGIRLTAFLPPLPQSKPGTWVDSRVRVRGVCGTWFNRLRQLFGARLLVPRSEDIIIEEPALTNVLAQPPRPIGDLLSFAPHASHGHRVKVVATVVLQQPGRALFVQDDQHGLYVQTRRLVALFPGDRIELTGFPDKGEYTPMLQDATWTKLGSGPAPVPTLISPDEALAGLYDSRLVSIEGRLLEYTHGPRDAVLLLEAADQIFSAHLDTLSAGPLPRLRNNSRLRVTGVCRIEVGDEWRATPEWRAKSFRVLMRTPADVSVLALPPWWTLRWLLWAVPILIVVALASLAWVTLLHRKVAQQTAFIRQQQNAEARLKER
jgi:hypothetical protein